MKRSVLMYGILAGLLIPLLRWTEYRFLVVEHSLQIYGALTAITFAVLGIWLGSRLSGRSAALPGHSAALPETRAHPFVPDESKRADLSITRREMEILELIAEGLSNREIAERLFVSENTVKTHSSRILSKLGAKRRTHAVQIGKEFGLLR